MARIGLLTGGGDCPGLNAVIRAVVRRGLAEGGHSFLGFRHGWAGVLRRRRDRAEPAEHRRHPAARRHDPRHLAHQPLRRRARRHGRRARTLDARDVDALIPIGGEDTLGVGAAPARRRRADRRRAQDDRQRPRRHRRDVRLPDRRADRHRRDRPPAHDRRVAQPRDGGRGDGPPRRLDRDLRGDRRRRRRDPRARAAVRHRAGRRAPAPAPRARAAASRSSSSPRAPTPREGTLHDPRGRPPTDAFGHARLGGIGVALEQEIERRTGYREPRHDPRPRPARRHAGGVRPRAGDPLRRRRDGRRGRRALRRDGRRCAARRSSRSPLGQALREPKLLDPALYATAELFFG